MVNYQNSIIYKICCKDVNIKEIYIGSTANDLRIRKSGHKTKCNNENDNHYNYYVYQFIRENGGWDNWDMVVVEKYKCENKQQLHTRERFWFEELKATLNKQIPNRSLEEYVEDNKETIAEYQKDWYQKNKETFLEYKKEHYQKNKELILDQQKKYREDNKEKIAEKAKEFRQKNKETIAVYQKKYHQDYYEKNKDKLKEKIDCQCGGKYTHQNKARHLKSKKHLKYLQNLNNNN